MTHALTLITFVPLIGMVLILICPASLKAAYRWIAVAATVPQLIIAGWLYANFNTSTTAMQFAERASWISAYHIYYFLGIDGISISMVLLTALICFISVFASFSIDRAEKGYYALLLLLDTGMMGVFVSLDFFLFYIFWEVMLLPMYFLIGIWGGPRREYAAIKFFLYTLLGSVLILLAMLGLYYYGATHTFDMTVLAANASHYSITFQRIVWIALFIGFAIKIPAFPFHTWLPDAHVEAPTAISVILAGVLLKMGTYGILRVNFPILPAASHEFGVAFSRRYRHHQHRLRCDVRDGADGLQEARRLFVDQPHGIRDARDGIVHRRRNQRRRAADVQPRDYHGDAVHPGRSDL